ARIKHQLDAVEAHLGAVAQHAIERADRIVAPEADTQSDLHGCSSLSSGKGAASSRARRSGRCRKQVQHPGWPIPAPWRRQEVTGASRNAETNTPTRERGKGRELHAYHEARRGQETVHLRQEPGRPRRG